MNISPVANFVPAAQPQQAVAAKKPTEPQPVSPVVVRDSDGDNDGSVGILA
jgi:hypothetical protein